MRCAVFSFEEFLVLKNNFYLHFINNFFGEMYRKSEAYQECYASNESFQKLTEILFQRKDYYSEEYYALLYQVYLMMRCYIDDDKMLFV
jgi:hypothetical protein